MFDYRRVAPLAAQVALLCMVSSMAMVQLVTDVLLWREAGHDEPWVFRACFAYLALILREPISSFFKHNLMIYIIALYIAFSFVLLLSRLLARTHLRWSWFTLLSTRGLLLDTGWWSDATDFNRYHWYYWNHWYQVLKAAVIETQAEMLRLW